MLIVGLGWVELGSVRKCESAVTCSGKVKEASKDVSTTEQIPPGVCPIPTGPSGINVEPPQQSMTPLFRQCRNGHSSQCACGTMTLLAQDRRNNAYSHTANYWNTVARPRLGKSTLSIVTHLKYEDLKRLRLAPIDRPRLFTIRPPVHPPPQAIRALREYA
jgi:hypothetical protein